jgi:hypothetical protein
MYEVLRAIKVTHDIDDILLATMDIKDALNQMEFSYDQLVHGLKLVNVVSQHEDNKALFKFVGLEALGEIDNVVAVEGIGEIFTKIIDTVIDLWKSFIAKIKSIYAWFIGLFTKSKEETKKTIEKMEKMEEDLEDEDIDLPSNKKPGSDTLFSNQKYPLVKKEVLTELGNLLSEFDVKINPDTSASAKVKDPDKDYRAELEKLDPDLKSTNMTIVDAGYIKVEDLELILDTIEKVSDKKRILMSLSNQATVQVTQLTTMRKRILSRLNAVKKAGKDTTHLEEEKQQIEQQRAAALNAKNVIGLFITYSAKYLKCAKEVNKAMNAEIQGVYYMMQIEKKKNKTK